MTAAKATGARPIHCKVAPRSCVADLRGSTRVCRHHEVTRPQEAIRIATEYETVTIGNYKIDKLKELEPLTMPGTGVRDLAQWQLQAAAPGRFREILIDVMGPRCTPCERPSDEQKTVHARKKKGKSVSSVDATDEVGIHETA